MKFTTSRLSVAIAQHDAPANAFVVWRGFEDSIVKASLMGYSGIELALHRSEDIEVDLLDSLLCKYNMAVSSISTGQVFSCSHLYLTSPDPDIRTTAISILQDLIHLAAKYNTMVNLGRVRGFRAEGQSFDEVSSLACESLSRLAETAESCNVDLIIEPINRYESNFINRLEECAHLISRIGSSKIGIMADVFHMNIEEVMIGKALRDNCQHLKYIHLADSNRLAPGWGHINFAEIFDALVDIEYRGWLCAEILPAPTPDAAAAQAAKYLLPWISYLNKSLSIV